MTNPRELYTHSRLTAYRACPRKHYYAYELGVRERRPAAALQFGTALHEGLRAYWELRRRAPDGAPGADRAEAALDGAGKKPVADLFERQKLEAMLLAYVAVWDGWHVRVEHVELPFRVPLRDPETHAAHPTADLGGQMDLVLRSPRTGNVVVVEHKGSARDASPDQEYVYRLKIDGQIGIYFHAAEALGLAPTEVIYDIARKPLQKPLKGGRGKPPEDPAAYGARVREAVGADPGAFVRRVRVPRPDREQAEVWRDVWSWVGKIERSASDGDWPRNPDACFRYGTPCPYLQVCSGGVDIDDPVLFIRAGKHVELRTEASRTMTVDDALDF